jgi:hypothetical protein
MTTTIKIQSHNTPAVVEISDYHPDTQATSRETRVLRPEDGEVSFYCTTTRAIRVIDVEGA